jgi:hypothetical protein
MDIGILEKMKQCKNKRYSDGSWISKIWITKGKKFRQLHYSFILLEGNVLILEVSIDYYGIPNSQ